MKKIILFMVLIFLLFPIVNAGTLIFNESFDRPDGAFSNGWNINSQASARIRDMQGNITGTEGPGYVTSQVFYTKGNYTQFDWRDNVFLPYTYFQLREDTTVIVECSALGGNQFFCWNSSGRDIIFDADAEDLWLHFEITINSSTSYNITVSNMSNTNEVYNSVILCTKNIVSGGINNIGIRTVVDAPDKDVTLDNISVYDVYTPYIANIAFKSPTPTNGQRNTTFSDIIINVISDSGGNISVWWNGTIVGNGSEASPFNFSLNTSLVPHNGTFYYNATNGETTTDLRSWTYDAIDPIITLNSNNFFPADNSSNFSKFDTFLINMTFTDNDDLFAYEINITNTSGTPFFNFTNISLEGTSVSISHLLNVALWGYGRYNMDIYLSDSHTQYEIPKYIINTLENGLKFKTPEENEILIYSTESAIVTKTKKTDRYSIGFEFDKKGNHDRTFILECENGLYFQDKSKYKAHFVCFNKDTRSGNWIDFEEYEHEGQPVINRIGENKYEITFINMKDNVIFNSIGGLNIVHQTYKFWLETQYPSETYLLIDGQKQWNYSGEFSTTQNISINATKINKILEWNCNCTDCTIDGNYCLIPFLWHSDTDGILEINLTNATFEYGIDNCSNEYDIDDNKTFHIFTKDQKTDTVLTTNGTFLFDYYFNTQTIQYAVNMYGRNNYTFCIYPSWSNPISDQTNSFIADLYESLDFYRFNEYLDKNFTAYLLPIEATSSYITYIVTDNNLAKIQGANMKVYRTIGGVNTLVYEAETDFAGQINLYQDQQYLYYYVINASGYPLKTFQLKPVSSLYTIKLTEVSQSQFDNKYSDVKYKIYPKLFLFDNDDSFKNITLEILGGGLEYYGVNVTNFAGNCVPSDCSDIQYSSTGGNATVRINYTGGSDVFRITMFFKRPGEDVVIIKGDGGKITHFEQTKNSMYELFKSVHENTTDIQRVFLFVMFNLGMLALLYELGIAGIFGLPLLIISNLIFTYAGCNYVGLYVSGSTSESCTFYFIHPTIGIFTTLVALLGYISIRARAGD